MGNNVRTLKKPTRTKGAPPAAEVTPTPNVQKAPSGKKVQIPIMAEPELKREFKAYCADRDISMSKQFEEMFAFWKSQNS